MSDSGNLNLNLNNVFSFNLYQTLSEEQKKEIIKAAEEAGQKLDSNNDGQVSEEEFNQSMNNMFAYVQKFGEIINKGLSTTGVDVQAKNTEEQSKQLTENASLYDLDGDGKISNEEYERGRYMTEKSGLNTASNPIQNSLNKIKDLVNEPNLRSQDSPSLITQKAKNIVEEFMTELRNGKYTADEIEKALKDLDNTLKSTQSRLAVNYDTIYRNNHLDSDRKEIREIKNIFMASFSEIIAKNAELLSELKATHTDFLPERSYTILQNLNKIANITEYDKLENPDNTFENITFYLNEIEAMIQKSTLRGTNPKDYLKKQDLESILISLDTARTKMFAIINNNASYTEQEKKAFEDKFNVIYNRYYFLQEKAKDKPEIPPIPSEIQSYYSKLSEEGKSKRDVIDLIKTEISKLLSDKMSAYLKLEDADEKEKARAEIKNLRDLLELHTIPEGISDDVLNDTDLFDLYKELANPANENINATKIDILNALKNAKVGQSIADELEIKAESYGATLTKESRDEKDKKIEEILTAYKCSDTQRINTYKIQYDELSKQLFAVIKESGNIQEQDDSSKKYYNERISDINSDIEMLKTRITELGGNV